MAQETQEVTYGEAEAGEDLRIFLALIDVSHELDPTALAGELEELYLGFAEYLTDYETVDEFEEETIREQLYQLCVARNRTLEQSIKRGNTASKQTQTAHIKLPGIDAKNMVFVVDLTNLNGDINQAQPELYKPNKDLELTGELQETQERFNLVLSKMTSF